MDDAGWFKRILSLLHYTQTNKNKSIEIKTHFFLEFVWPRFD